MTVIPLRRRARPQVIDLDTHRERMVTGAVIAARTERARAAEWLRTRAEGFRLDADHEGCDGERAAWYRVVACELETAARDMETGQ